MKFLCLQCDQVMKFSERELPGDGTLTVIFTCGACGREMALLTNPMETQLVTSLGVEIGGRTVPEQPFQQTRTKLDEPREDAFQEPVAADGTAGATQDRAPQEAEAESGARISVTWSPEANDRLGNVPKFVRGMVKRIYADYAQENRIEVITPEVMDRARTDLGLEGM